MSDGTGISWADVRLVGVSGAHQAARQIFDQIGMPCAPSQFEPGPHILRFLARIAGTAARHNVAGCRWSFAVDRHDVIPAIGLATAIGALAAEQLRQGLHRFGRQRSNTTDATSDLLSPSHPVLLISLCIALARLLLLMRLADAASNLLNWAPRLALATPCLAEQTPCPSLGDARSWRLPGRLGASAVSALRIHSVESSSIRPEVVSVTPLVTAIAPLLSRSNFGLVLSGRHAERFGPHLQGSCRSL